MDFYFLKTGNLRFCLRAETNCYIIFYTEYNKLQERGLVMAAKNVKCSECTKIKEWSFSENVVAFCPVVQKYVKAENGCKKGEKKK